LNKKREENTLEEFDKLIEFTTLLSINNEILQKIKEMKSVIEKGNKTKFKEKYDAFMQSAADHITVLDPFIRFLTKLFL
jgi:hypothetical protein